MLMYICATNVLKEKLKEYQILHMFKYYCKLFLGDSVNIISDGTKANDTSTKKVCAQGAAGKSLFLIESKKIQTKKFVQFNR